MNESFDKLSINLTNKLTKQEKQNEGIYFTSNTIIKPSITLIIKFLKSNNINNILEPSCGSCQFINYIKNNINYNLIHGIELNNTIYNEIKNIYNDPNIKLLNKDFLSFNTNIKYNLITGNPPFFVLKKPKIKIN